MQDFYCTIYLLDNAIMYTCLVPNVIMPHPKKAKCNLEQQSAGYNTLSKNSDKVFKKLCTKFLNDVHNLQSKALTRTQK